MERARNDLEEHQLVCVCVLRSEAMFAPRPRNSTVGKAKNPEAAGS
jgi:hypothetical protein